MTDEQRQKILEAIESNQKILAIKLYREATGSDLRDAKDFVEELTAKLTESETPPPVDLEQTVLQHLREGDKLAAIKLYREATGTGLRAAKEAVERMASRHNVPVSSGCSGVLLFAITAFSLVAAIAVLKA